MRKMIAMKDFPYGMDHRKVDEEFEAHDHDVDALEHIGLARIAKPVKNKGIPYQTRAMTADSTPASPASKAES